MIMESKQSHDFHPESVPVEITADLIRQMRFEGRYEAAKELLQAFHRDVKKTGMMAFNKEVSEIKRIKAVKGLCSDLSCLERSTKTIMCDYHREKRNSDWRKRYRRMKE